MSIRQSILDAPPPHSIESEMALLGALILDPPMVAEILPVLGDSEVFYDEANARIFAAMRWLFERGEDWDAVALMERLRDRGHLEAIGGTAYLRTLATSIHSAVNAPYYARTVSDRARARKLAEACWRALEGLAGGAEFEDISQAAVAAVHEATDTTHGENSITVFDAAQDCIRAIDEGLSEYLPTGYPGFDSRFGGLPKQGLVTIIAPSGHGKSTWAINVLANIAREHHVRVFSFEMPARRIAEAVLSRQCCLPVRAYARGVSRPSMEDYRSMDEASVSLKSMSFEIVDDHLDARQIFARCHRLRAQGVRVVVVDYLQNLPQLKGHQSQFSSIVESAQILQRIGRQLGLCVVMVCQGDKDAVKRGHPLSLSDAYGGIVVDQVTDFGISLFRPGAVKGQKDEAVTIDPRHTEIHIVKNKYGETTDGDPVVQTFHGAWASFTDGHALGGVA